MRRVSNRKLSNVLIWTGVVILLVMLVGLVIYGYFNRQWDGQTRFTLISLDDNAEISSFDPLTRQGIKINIPSNLEIDSLAGRGKWQVGVLTQAGSPSWAADSLANYLGITHNLIQKLTWWDKLMWRRSTSGIDWQKVDLEKTSLIVKFQAPDDLELYRLNSGWDIKVREWFVEQVIASQTLGVVVVNTTLESGLGANAARIVESMGFKVRELKNIDLSEANCIIQSSPDFKNNPAVRKLKNAFECNWQPSNEIDIKIILGKRYQERLKGN